MLQSELKARTEREPFKDGLRYAKCLRCGMGWIEHERQIEGFLPPGPRDHICPDPFPRAKAQMLYEYYASTGIPTSQRIKAAIMLGIGLVIANAAK